MMMVATTLATLHSAEFESISKGADFTRVELAPPEIGLYRLVITYQ
jgi:hypothetical protein